MTKQELLDYFGGVSATATALCISAPSVSNWYDPLPALRQLQVERMTRGALRAGPECDKYRVAPRARAA